jgi:hypothetical protein
MKNEAHSVKQILVFLLEVMQEGRYYHVSELYDLLIHSGKLNEHDLQPHSGGTETKAYRRTANALRDGSNQGILGRNEYSSNRYQYQKVA